MRFFHLSDLHIGLKLMNRDLGEDQAYILHQVVDHAGREQPDAVVIAGDIYDKAVPSAEAVEIFDGFLSDLVTAVPSAAIMMISGNHDSAPRVDCYRHILAGRGVYMIGQPPREPQDRIQRVVLEDAYGKVNFYLLPFVKPSMVRQVTGKDDQGNNLSYREAVGSLLERERIDEKQRNVLVSHQFYLPMGVRAEDVERMDSEIRTLGNIDEISSEVLKPFDYAALGHIHKPMKVGSENYRYCGTPLACSVSEAGQEKGVILVEMGEKGRVETSVLPLCPLRQVQVLRGGLEEVLQQTCTDYVTVVLTDPGDLNILDMQDRLRNAFPNLLEIRRENLRKADYSRRVSREKLLDPFALCCAFLQETGEEEKSLLRDVIHHIEGVR